MQQQLILVNENDQEIGFGDKLQVHRNGQLHRAFSIFVLNNRDELLIQRRAWEKYHSGGLWGNTCCSHPIKNEIQDKTVHRRLIEEMGFDCELSHLFSFIYRAELDNQLTEYEFDHVYFGRFNGIPNPNPEEVCEFKWIGLEELREDLIAESDKYVYWIKPAFERFYDLYKKEKERFQLDTL
jgi:isopentenyl-diphosphate delta-isomerase